MLIRSWLSWPDSLTERVAAHLQGSVQVRVLSERVARILPDEQQHLWMRGRIARIREVQLEVRGVPYVVARTVFPESTAHVMNDALTRLGTRSLGSLLFGPKRAPVVMREWIALEGSSMLRRLLHAHLPAESASLWARRALHLLADEPLLVTEIFLPALLTMAPVAAENGSKD